MDSGQQPLFDDALAFTGDLRVSANSASSPARKPRNIRETASEGPTSREHLNSARRLVRAMRNRNPTSPQRQQLAHELCDALLAHLDEVSKASTESL
ncbi:MAG: hypothetical protein AAF918_09260 [Pseudomonadota bacterium]